MTALSGQCRRLMKIARNFILPLKHVVCVDVSYVVCVVMCSVVYWSMVLGGGGG